MSWTLCLQTLGHVCADIVLPSQKHNLYPDAIKRTDNLIGTVITVLN